MADTDERYTPESVLDVVRRLAPIGLDPCTIAENPTCARRWFTREDNGLERPWFEPGKARPTRPWPGTEPARLPTELAYVNPPYSRGELIRWALKVANEASGILGDHEIIMLTPCDLSTRWATVLYTHCQAFAGWRGRIEFITPGGAYDAGAKQPSIFWYFGARAERFGAAFEDDAHVVILGGS